MSPDRPQSKRQLSLGSNNDLLRHLGQIIPKRARKPDNPLSQSGSRESNESNNNSHAGPSSGSARLDHPQQAPMEPKESSTERTRNPAWTGLEKALRALHLSTEVLPPLHSAVGSLVSCLDKFEMAAKYCKDYEELALNLEAMAELLKRYLQDERSVQVTNRISNIAQIIDKEVKQADKRKHRVSTERVLIGADDGEDLIRRYRRIGHLFHRLQVEINMSTWSIANEHLMNTRLENLSPSKLATYNSKLSTEISRRTCTENTREGVLSGIHCWTDTPNTEPIYWMNGMAGTGKTTIACSLATVLESRGQLGASFFCTRTSPECRDANRIVPTIAYQLARFSTPFQRALCQVLDGDPDVSTRNIPTQFERLLKEPLLEIKDQIPASLVVVIDALDECDDDNVVGLVLDMLFRFALNLPLKFFVTSRPEPTIRSKMMVQSESARSVLYLHEIERSIVQSDIELYLREELAFMSPPLDQLKQLAELAGNLFIYAATAVRYIRPGRRAVNHKQRLATILAVNSTSAKKLADIDALYSTILVAALDDDYLELEEAECIQLVLWTVVCIREPVAMETLVALVGLESEEEALIALQPLRSVLHVSERSNFVSTLHASFPDYMLNQERSRRFFCNEGQHSCLLARRCFEVMKAQLRFNICNLDSSFVPDKEIVGLNERINSNISKTLSYASRFWGDHLSLAIPSSELDSILYEFLSDHLLFWLEVLNLKECTAMGSKSLQSVQTWLSRPRYSTSSESRSGHFIGNIQGRHVFPSVAEIVSQPSITRLESLQSPLAPDPSLVRFIGDAHRFVASFAANPISLSTPHLYISALPFIPKSSLISKHYQSYLQGLMNVAGSAMARREAAALATWTSESPIAAVAYSAEGARIVYGSTGHELYVRDAHNGSLLVGPIEGHTGPVLSVGFSMSGMYIVSGSQDCTIRVWSAYSGAAVAGPFEQGGPVRSVEFSPSDTHVISGSDDYTIRIWDIDAQTAHIGPLEGHAAPVTSVRFSPDGSHIVSGSQDCTILVWDLHNGQPVTGPIKGHTKSVKSVAFSPVINYSLVPGSTDRIPVYSVVSGSADCTVRTWSTSNGLLIAGPFEGHTGSVTSVAYSPDGKCILSGSDDRTIRIWNSQNGQLVAGPLEGHTGPISSVEFSPNGIYFVSASLDSTIRIWGAHSTTLPTRTTPNNVRTKRSPNVHDETVLSRLFQGHTNSILSVGFSPNGTRIVSGSADHTIRIWDALNGALIIGPIEGHTGPVVSASFSHDNVYIVSGSDDCTIRTYTACNGILVLGPIKGHTSSVLSVTFSLQGTCIVSGSADHTIRVWDACDGALLMGPIQGHTGPVRSVGISPDGTRLISGSDDCTICIWNAQNGALHIGPIEGHTGSVESISFSPGGAFIASGSQDQTVCVWSTTDGSLFAGPFKGHNDSVRSVRFSPDGAQIVSGSNDRTVQIWDVQRGTLVAGRFEGHAGFVLSVGFSPDGQRVVSGSVDCTIRVWSVRDGTRIVRPFDGLPDSAWFVGPSCTTHVVSGSGGCTIRASESLCVKDVSSDLVILWATRPDGWLVDSSSRLLFWIPPELRGCFPRTGNLVTIGRQGALDVDLNSLLLGNHWHQCYIDH